MRLRRRRLRRMRLQWRRPQRALPRYATPPPPKGACRGLFRVHFPTGIGASLHPACMLVTPAAVALPRHARFGYLSGWRTTQVLAGLREDLGAAEAATAAQAAAHPAAAPQAAARGVASRERAEQRAAQGEAQGGDPTEQVASRIHRRSASLHALACNSVTHTRGVRGSPPLGD